MEEKVGRSGRRRGEVEGKELWRREGLRSCGGRGSRANHQGKQSPGCVVVGKGRNEGKVRKERQEGWGWSWS